MGRAKSGYAATAPAAVRRGAASAVETYPAVQYSRKALEEMADELEAQAPTAQLEKPLAVGTAVALSDDTGEPQITGLILRAHMSKGKIQYRVRWRQGAAGFLGDGDWGDYERSDLVVVC